MSFTARTRYLLVSLAIVTASVIQLARGYKAGLVAVCAITFLVTGNLVVYLAGSKERALRRRQKRDFWASALLLAFALTGSAAPARAQLLGEPPIPPKADKSARKAKKNPANLEWLWQYSPPPAEGREYELIQDSHFRPFLDQYFVQPQSFWGPNPTDPKSPIHKSLAETAYDFLAIPGVVIADENRYITATGAVRRFPTSRGLLFADLDTAQPLVVFAAIDWIRDSKTVADPAAEYTLWIFPNMLLPGETPGSLTETPTLPRPLARSLARWSVTPLPGSGIVQNVTHAIVVDPDGTPHQVPVPGGSARPSTPNTPSSEDVPVLSKRPSS